MYKIIIPKSFKKQLKKIDPKFLQGIRKLIENLKEDPYSKSTKTKDTNLPERKTRKGKFRILFDINKDKKEVSIKAIDMRDAVYKPKK